MAATPVPAPLRRQPSAEDVAAFERLRAPAYNPFINATMKLPLLQKIKMLLIGLTLFPIRLLFTALVMTAAAAACGLSTCGLTVAQLNEPLAPWRLACRGALFLLVRTQLWLMGYYWLIVKGSPASKADAPIVVANHITFVEPIVLWYLTGGTALSAVENASIPLVGGMLRAMQCIFVDRGARDNSSVRAAIAARARDARMPHVLIFPEGTCSNGRRVVTFKSGAFEPGTSVQPVAVKYRWQHFDPSWPSVSPGLFGLLLRTFTQVYNTIEVEFLPVVTPSEEERRAPRLYAQRVQQLIATACGVGVTQHSFDDVQLAQVALKSHYPAEVAIVELAALRSALNIDVRIAKQYLAAFIRADVAQTGQLTFTDFCNFLATCMHGSVAADAPQQHAQGSRRYSTVAPLTPVLSTEGVKLANVQELRHLFTLLDVDGSGTLNFREFLVGLAIINERGIHQRSDAIRLAFKAMDTDEDGRLSREELQRTLRRVYPDMTAEQFEARFAAADANHDGMVGYHEFAEWVAANPDAVPLVRQTYGFNVDLVELAAAGGTSAAGGGAVSNPPLSMSPSVPGGGGGANSSVDATLSPPASGDAAAPSSPAGSV